MAQSDSERSSRYRQRKKAAEATMMAAAMRRDRDDAITSALLDRLFQPAPAHLRPFQSAMLAHILTDTGNHLDRIGIEGGRSAMRELVERHHTPRPRHLSIEDSRLLRKRLLDPATYCRHAPATPSDSCVTRTDCNATTTNGIADRTRDDTKSGAETEAASLLAELQNSAFGHADFDPGDSVFLDDLTGLPVCLLPGQDDDEELDDPEIVEARNRRDVTAEGDETDDDGSDRS